jgi:hypothetical protein
VVFLLVFGAVGERDIAVSIIVTLVMWLLFTFIKEMNQELDDQ